MSTRDLRVLLYALANVAVMRSPGGLGVPLTTNELRVLKQVLKNTK